MLYSLALIVNRLIVATMRENSRKLLASANVNRFVTLCISGQTCNSPGIAQVLSVFKQYQCLHESGIFAGSVCVQRTVVQEL